jgi:dephospho-CoA kinase
VKEEARPFLVGLTGPIGAGKSEIAAVWAKRGAGIVEGDAMGRLALEDANLRRALAERFSREIIKNDGSINRSRLAVLAFASVEAQRDLTRLTFPTLYRLACAEMTALGREHRIVVFDAALIFEWGVEADFNVMVAVAASQPLLVKRAAERLGVDEAAAEARLALQLSPAEKAARADYVIVNDGDLKTLQARAREVWHIIAGRGALGRE